MQIRKKLIEVALPLEAINVASAREKSIRHGHPSTLHLWWARRPLAACRAVLFGQLVDDPSAWPEQYPTVEAQDGERQRLFGLITDLVQWENSNKEPVINAARTEIARSLARGRNAEGAANDQDEAVLRVPPAYGADGRYRDLTKGDVAVVNRYLAEVAPPVHDPFAGGGSIPLEAQRLGLRAIATDLNPVAVLINKALIEIPPKFAGMAPVNPESRRKTGMQSWKGAQGLAEDVRYYGKWMRDEAFKRIGHLYPDVDLPKEQGGGKAPVIAWLWARTVRCPNPTCGKLMPLVRSFALSTRAGKEARVAPTIGREDGVLCFQVMTGPGVPPPGTVSKQGATCIACNTPVALAHIREEAMAGRLSQQLMAVVAEGKGDRCYVSPDDAQKAIATTAVPTWMPDTRLPDKALGFRVQAYGMTRHSDLFSSRQSLALNTFAELVLEARSQVAFISEGGPQYADAIATYLGLAIDRLADRCSTLCTWDTGQQGVRETKGGGARAASVRNVFSRQTIAMTWDYAEANPLGAAAGTFDGACEWIANVLQFLPPTVVAATSIQADAAATEPVESPRVYSTDPPYYDNIGYADLSDFFYVWLRRSLVAVHPTLFSTILVPKDQELIASPFRFEGSRKRADDFFERGLTKAFHSLCNGHSPDFPVTIYYAFKQAETDADQGAASTGWETFLEAVRTAGFSFGGTWPMRTELGSRMVGSGTNALASSIVLVCRKRPDDAPIIDRTTFRRLLRQELPAALRHLQKGNIAPVDMAQASIGPGMAIYSRHAKVLEPDGSAMSVRTALQLINQALDEYLTEQEGEFDAHTRFAVTWFETRQFDAGAYGEAETLAKARNVAVSGVAEAGIIHSAGGKVRLLRRDELPDDWNPATDKRPTIWEATQHLIKRLESKGEPGAAELLATLGQMAAPARDLAYRLYTTCERKKWAEEARAYNGLVVAWPEVEKLAAQVGRSSGKPQMDLL